MPRPAPRSRPSLLLLLLAFLALALPLLAWGQEMPAALPAAAGPGLDYLLGLGPIGALVYGAWLLGRGVTVKIQVELTEPDRELLRRGVVALERGQE